MDLTDLASGFPGRYWPTDGEMTRLWDEGILVLDASVLLGFYRYSEETREAMFRFELRRTVPKIVVPTLALLYATTPVRALLGTCIITSVQTADLAVLWREHGSRSDLRHHEFQQYFDGVDVGTALVVTQPRAFGRRVPLQDLRAKPRGFRPPQSFANVDAKTGDRYIRMAA